MEFRMESMQIIEIRWEKCNGESPEKPGCLYCVYGDSPIYGRNALLYIGYTSRTSTTRMMEHDKKDQFSRIVNKTLRVGTILHNDGELSDETLKKVESLLITMTKPSYNSENINDINDRIKPSDHFCLILNKEDRGSLPLEISNIWWEKE